MSDSSCSPKASLRVVLLLRGDAPGQFSVERVFREVADALPCDIDGSLVQVPRPSRGLLARVRNMLFTARLKADVVHITGDIQYCALAVLRSRCLLTILDLGSLRRLTGWRRQIVDLVWYRLPVRRATVVTTISDAVRDEVVDLLPRAAKKTKVIGCPVSAHFAPASDRAGGSGAFRVLVVGTYRNKNLELVASALEGLPVHLHVVGHLQEEQRDLLHSLNLSYSQVSNITDSEMVAAYQSSSVLVFASTYEGFGLPILEAQACGIPVVTSSIPPMCDVAGGAAVLVDPYDAASIRRGVEAIFDNAALRSALREAGLANAAAHSPMHVASRYADIYRRIASGAR